MRIDSKGDKETFEGIITDYIDTTCSPAVLSRDYGQQTRHIRVLGPELWGYSAVKCGGLGNNMEC